MPGKPKLLRGVALGFSGLNSFEGAGAAGLGVEFGFAACQAAEKCCDLFAERGGALHVAQDFFIGHVVLLVAMRAGRFHAPFLPPSRAGNNSQTASPSGVSGRYIKTILSNLIFRQ